MKFIATMTHSYQNGPDTMAHDQRHLIVTEDTTVAEIVKWASVYQHSEIGPDMNPITLAGCSDAPEVKK